jgi:hypothetical protein
MTRKAAKSSVRAHYRIDIPGLLAAGLLNAGDNIIGTHRGLTFSDQCARLAT